MKKTMIWLSPFLLAALFFVTSCSDDKKEETKTYKDGDENSQEFEALMDGEQGMIELTANMFDGALFIGGLILGDTANPNSNVFKSSFPAFAQADSVPIVSITKTYRAGTSDWLVNVTVRAVRDDGDSASFIFTDSMKFFHGNTAVQWPDSASLTKIENGMALEVQEGTSGFASHGGIFAGHKWSIAGAPGELASGGDVALQGSGYCDIEFDFVIDSTGATAQSATSLSCDGLFDFSQQVDGLALNIDYVDNTDGCPSSGSIHFGGEVDAACLADSGSTGGFEIQGDHTFDVSYDGENVTIVARSDDTQWNVAFPCPGTGPVKVTSLSSWQRIAGLLCSSKRK